MKRYPPTQILSLSRSCEEAGDHAIDPEIDERLVYLSIKSEEQKTRKKLLPHEVKAIRRALLRGEPGSQIAQRMGIDPSTVCRIRRGKSYRDVK